MVELALAQDNARQIVAAARAALPQLQAIAAPAPHEVVDRVLAHLALVCPPPAGRGDRHWKAVIREYYDALKDFPREALIEAATQWRNSPESRFFPYPGQLRGLAEPVARRIQIAAYRCKLLAEAEERAVPPAPTEEEMAERRRLAAEVKAAVSIRPVPGGQARTQEEVATELRRVAELDEQAGPGAFD